MRLNKKYPLIVALFLFLGLPGLSWGWECSPDDYKNVACGKWLGSKKWCDLTEAERARVWKIDLSCDRNYTYYGISVSGSPGDLWSVLHYGFVSVDCNGGDCDLVDDDCAQLKQLFDPPAPDCNFKFSPDLDCQDGEGSNIYGSGKLKASDGRVVDYSYGDHSSPVECTNWVDIDCSFAETPPEKCWRDFETSDSGPSDPSNPADDDCFDGKVKTCVSYEGSNCVEYKCVKPWSGCTDDQTKVCVDESDCSANYICVPNSDSGSGSGSGICNSDQEKVCLDGSDDCESNYICKSKSAGGGSGQYPDECYEEICDGDVCVKKLKDSCLNGSGSGSGSGDGSGSGTGDGSGGDGDGDESSWKPGSVLDGWNDDGKFNQSGQESELSSFFDRYAESKELKKIKDHEYIKTSNAKCSISVILFSRTYEISLCEWSDELGKFGVVLKAIVGILGFLLILRGRK